MNIAVPKKVKLIIETLKQNGFEAFAVGGCIRDSLLNKAPHDWDVTTNADTDKIKECFSEYRILETGIKHGTLTLMIDSEAFEITTYRSDGKYSDHRRPDKVTFTSNIKDDLARRDFTVNAIACDGEKIIDCFGGISDIQNRIIRCVGDPAKRFDEDALRILRALRFSAVLGFEIEEKTAKAIRDCRSLLENVSAERIFSELEKLLCGENVYNVLMSFSEMFAFLIPPLAACIDFDQNNPHHSRTLFDHTAYAVSLVKAEPELRFAALLHDLGKPLVRTTDSGGISHYASHQQKSAVLAESVLRGLRCSNKFLSSVSALVISHDTPIESKKTLKKLMLKYGNGFPEKLFEIKKADIAAQSDYKRKEKLAALKRAQRWYEEIKIADECIKITDLKINGFDLINLGCKEGKKVGEILNVLLEAVLGGELENSADALLQAAEELVCSTEKIS